ncbi:MAG: LysR substrate-binding domain-containing protein, partial [Pseudomonadales bacterium]
SDFQASTAELEIRYGSGQWEGFQCERLIKPELRLYCSLESAKKLRRPADVVHFDLLDVFGTPKGWREWCEQHNTALTAANAVQYMDSHATAATMAANGMGLCLLYDALAAEGVLAQQLISPFSEALETQGSYYLCYPSGKVLSTGARCFADWLLEESDRD